MAPISAGSEGYLEESPPLYKLLSEFKMLPQFNSGSRCYTSARLNLALQLSACASHTVILIPSVLKLQRVSESPAGVVRAKCLALPPEFLIQQAWHGTLEFAFLTGSQVMLSGVHCFKSNQ